MVTLAGAVMGARAPSEAAAAVARAFETASCRFASEIASRSPRTTRGSGIDPGGPGDSGDDIVQAPRRSGGDARVEPPDASGPATTSFASPGGHHVGFIQYHPPVAASAEGAYAPASERARRAFGAPSSANDAESSAANEGARVSSARGVRAAGGSGAETDSDRPFETDRDADAAASRPDARSGGIFAETAHAFVRSPPLSAQTRFAGNADVSLWDLEVALKLGGRSTSGDAETARARGDAPGVALLSRRSNVARRDRRDTARRRLLRRFAEWWNPSSLETTETLRTRPGTKDADGDIATSNFESGVPDSSASVCLVASPAPPSALLRAHADGWGARELELELGGGKFAKRLDGDAGAARATRTRRSWAAAVDLTGAARPTVEWVELTEKDETERERLVGAREAEGKEHDDGVTTRAPRVRSAKTRVRLSYRTPLAFAGLHPLIRAVEMRRRRHAINDRACVEVRRVRSPWRDRAADESPDARNERARDGDENANVGSDVLDARVAAEARPSFLRVAARWRAARTFERTFETTTPTAPENRVTSRTTCAVTYEGVTTVAPRDDGSSPRARAFRQKASFEADVVARVSPPRNALAIRAPNEEASSSGFVPPASDRPSAAWRARLCASSRLRSARETPCLTFSCAREGARWTVAGETRLGNAEGDGSAPSRTSAFSARRACASRDAPPQSEGAFAECRVSFVGGDARAFATFATGAASIPSGGRTRA